MKLFLIFEISFFFHAVRCCGKMIRIILDDKAGEFSIEFKIELSDRSCNKKHFGKRKFIIQRTEN